MGRGKFPIGDPPGSGGTGGATGLKAVPVHRALGQKWSVRRLQRRGGTQSTRILRNKERYTGSAKKIVSPSSRGSESGGAAGAEARPKTVRLCVPDVRLPLAGGFAFVVDYLVACKLLSCHAANYVCTAALRVCMEGVVGLESAGLIPLSYRDTRS